VGEYHFCTDCEHIKIKMVPGQEEKPVKELSCPARFNPREGKWILEEGKNPHECPRNANFMQLQKQAGDRKHR
jgi:hypothetical protein